MGENYQLHRVSIDMAKAYRQVHKADEAFNKDKADSAIEHLQKAHDDFCAALEHAAKAEDDVIKKAGHEIDKGNAELKKSIASASKGHDYRAEDHYINALNAYDKALHLIAD